MAMRGAAWLMALALTVAAPGASAAADYYTDAGLAAEKARYQERMRFLLEEGLLAFMTAEERGAVGEVTVSLPPRGAGPLAASAFLLDGRPVIRLPLLSLKFVEDLSIAYAWRAAGRHSLEPVDEYLFLLEHREAGFFPGGRRPAPLNALGVPPRIWERDSEVDDLSLRFRNTAWAFILAHELGHLRFGHLEAKAAPEEAQHQEEAADRFAVELLGRSGTIPMGMILWFQATAGYTKSRADFASDADYLAWMRAEALHPVNGRRMRNLAAALERQAQAAGNANDAEVLRFIADRLAAIGAIVEDPDMQRHLARCAGARRPQDLKRLDDRPCS